MDKLLLYLAGPIAGTSYNECANWRDYVDQILPCHIQAVSPLRGKEYLKEETAIKNSYEEHPLSSSKGIICRDRFDVMRCDAILVNFLGAKKVSLGTVMEIGWADAYRKPIIIVMENDNIHNHAMITEAAGYIVDNLNSGVKIATSILLPN